MSVVQGDYAYRLVNLCSQMARYEEIVNNAERTSAFAALAKTATNTAVTLTYVYCVGKSLDRLLLLITDDYLDRLNPEELQELKGDLQDAYSKLQQLSKFKEHIERHAFGGLVGRRVWERADDLGDRIETIVFRTNQDFQNLISKCASELVAAQDPRNAKKAERVLEEAFEA